MNKPLNIFYAEPDPDRWFKYDRYPRKLIRRIVRGKTRPGGVMMVAINLMQGLDKLGIPYRFNDYRYINQHPEEIACIIGKPHLLFERKWKNPIVFGAGIFSHPCEAPDLLTKFPNIKRLLVPGQWMRDMFKPFYGNNVTAWPTGIDTEYWAPVAPNHPKKTDFIIYDKIRWEHDKYATELLQPIIKRLDELSLSYTIIKYGSYQPTDLKQALDNARAAIFLCEHETQGLAYQQMLSSGVPILAWDRGGHWQDPYYYPRIKYGPVSSVPYWNDECGLKFEEAVDFNQKLDQFLSLLNSNYFNPRNYIVENLSLEKCALAYVQIVDSVTNPTA